MNAPDKVPARPDPLGAPTTGQDSGSPDVVHPALVVRKTVDIESQRRSSGQP